MFGPEYKNSLEGTAIQVLIAYLSGSSIAVLENIIVEKEELASSISLMMQSRPNCVIWFQPTGVATEKLAHVEKRIFELLKDVVSNPLDMSYMLDCIKRQKRQIMFQAEGSGGNFFATGIIEDYIFGERDGSTLREWENCVEYDKLETWTDKQWRDFLRKWMVDPAHISVLGKPSKDLTAKLKKDEEERVAARKAELGADGLAKLGEKLKAAMAKNDIEIPASLLQQWKVPGVESIHFIKTTTARSGLARNLGIASNNVQEIINSSKSDLPLFLQFEDISTNFVHLTLLFGTSNIKKEHRPLLPLFMENFFNTPIKQDGKRVEFEEVVTQLEQNTISYYMEGGGATFNAPESIALNFEIEPAKYQETIKWIQALMFDSIFDETRLNAGMSKILADIPEAKRNGNSMAHAVNNAIHLDTESTIVARGTLVKGVYLKRLRKMLSEEPQIVLSWLGELRKSIFTADNIRALVVADVKKLPSPVDAWKPLMSNLKPSQPMLPIVKPYQRLTANGQNPGNYGVVVVPMGTIDSSFCLAVAKGPTSPTDPILPTLMVATSFLEAVEGPLWTAVRGKGLAYGCNFRRDLNTGFVQFSVYRSPDAYRAFVAAKDVVESYIDGRLAFEQPALEGAISGIVVELADEQTTMATAGQFHFINGVIKGVDDEYDARMLKAVRNVTVDQIKAVMKDLLIPAMTPGTGNVVVTCAPIMEEVCYPFSLYIFNSLTHRRASSRASPTPDSRLRFKPSRVSNKATDSRLMRMRAKMMKTRRMRRALREVPLLRTDLRPDQ
jgi:Zn-dependent M16 (insulinase) family peptidase